VSNKSKIKNISKNGKVKEEIPEGVIVPTMEDYERLIQINQQLILPLANITQTRLLAEKDEETSKLKEEISKLKEVANAK